MVMNQEEQDESDPRPFLGLSKTAWITADIVRIAGGLLAEHWDVIQDEASRVSRQ